MDQSLQKLKKRWLLMEGISKKKSIKVLDEFNVYIVSGKSVRDSHHADFIGGGHYYVYPFIPKDEIWIEDIEPKSERQKILVHEMVELLLMRAKSMKYMSAHNIANNIESDLRDGMNPKQVFEKFVKTYFSTNKELAENLTLAYNSF